MLFFKTKMGMFKAAQEGVTISKNKWFSGVRASITQGSAGVDWWRGREHRKKKQESEGGVGGWGRVVRLNGEGKGEWLSAQLPGGGKAGRRERCKGARCTERRRVGTVKRQQTQQTD
jgi:hypothetical protein